MPMRTTSLIHDNKLIKLNTRASVDSDYANDTTHRRSVSGIAIKMAGGTIFYKTAFQATVALSSTEAEFIAACEAAKIILYIRSILDDINVRQESATTLYEDNQGALLMANSGQPTKRTRHMDTNTLLCNSGWNWIYYL